MEAMEAGRPGGRGNWEAGRLGGHGGQEAVEAVEARRLGGHGGQEAVEAVEAGLWWTVGKQQIRTARLRPPGQAS
jgi:hypothetical protein